MMISARFHLRLQSPDHEPIGPGKISLLEAIATEGSISAGAKCHQMSYRRAWQLVDEVNQALRSPAVITAVGGRKGGGAVLTPEGESLIRLYREVEAQALATNSDQLVQLGNLFNEAQT
jgi:molybdate transport system regulatory protein